jgi:redox-sensitive bicupin YhaK (pirin superfamily)
VREEVQLLQRRPWAELGGGDFGWLKAKHHFSVAGQGNPRHGPLGSLIVWNDDEIAPGTGFPLHGHRDVEIITYVRQGTVAHEDNLGNVGRIEAGDIQVMSAGTGIRHAEFNPGREPLKIYQIWIRPRDAGGRPRWESRPFPTAGQSGRLIVLASGFVESESALSIRADARVFGAVLALGDTVTHSLAGGRHAYLALAAGAVTVNGMRLQCGDGIAISDNSDIQIGALQRSELVLVETA